MVEQTTEPFKALIGGRTARFDRKLGHLLTWSAQIFADQGYDKSSIRQVAQAAGLSLAGLYHYVRCKEELLFFIQFHTFGALVEGLEVLVQQAASPEIHLKEMVSLHVRYLVQHLPELKLCTTELDSLGGDYYQQVLRRRQRYFELTRQILKRLQDQDHDSRVDPNLATLYLFGMLNWIVMWFDPQRNDPAEVCESLVDLFLGGYRATRDDAPVSA